MIRDEQWRNEKSCGSSSERPTVCPKSFGSFLSRALSRGERGGYRGAPRPYDQNCENTAAPRLAAFTPTTGPPNRPRPDGRICFAGKRCERMASAVMQRLGLSG